MGTNRNFKAMIFGVEEYSLQPEEKDFFRKKKPLGFILFSRNIKDKKQLRDLVADLRAAVENPNAPILIDQEGGRVCRLRAPTWYSPPPAATFGTIAKSNLDDAKRACALNAKLIAKDLAELGINVNCAPMVDIPTLGSHDGVIGDRAFSDDREVITTLAQEVVDNFLRLGITPIIKHIPGHGRATADSHLELPRVDTDYETLQQSDFYPFKNIKNAKWAMTAHVVYSAIDMDNPATHSSRVINEIRFGINFSGLIISDCITMKALTGSVEEKADRAFKAGCDLVIHSNGNMQEMQKIIECAPFLSTAQMDMISSSCHVNNAFTGLDRHETHAELKRILEKYQLYNQLSCTLQDPTENS